MKNVKCKDQAFIGWKQKLILAEKRERELIGGISGAHEISKGCSQGEEWMGGGKAILETKKQFS